MKSQTETTITLEQVIAAVREVAAEHPEHIYRTRPCTYDPTPDDPLGCLIGAAFRRLGVELSGGGQSVVVVCRNRKMITSTSSIHESHQMNWLSRVQVSQDVGRRTWKAVVADADNVYPQQKEGAK